MSDKTILHHINDLVAEENHLRDNAAAADPDGQRLRAVEHELDQCWDLLRQRRALREFGRSPGEAHVRDAGTVEGYTG